jgi:hypothetical protein
MQECLMDQGYNFSSSAELEIVRDIKERLGYVSMDYEGSLAKAATSPEMTKEYTLPDGNVVKLNVALFKCAELLFKPEMHGKELMGIHQLLYDSITKCDIDIRSDLYSNVVLSGGSTMFKNYEERLQKELQDLVPVGKSVKISAPDDRKYSVFVGGSILSSLPTFESMWITNEEFLEVGGNIANRKCM